MTENVRKWKGGPCGYYLSVRWIFGVHYYTYIIGITFNIVYDTRETRVGGGDGGGGGGGER